MNVLIIGANGGIGRILSKQLQQTEGFSPTAMIRKAEQKEYFEEIGVETVIGDLEDSVENLGNIISGQDAVVFTAGSGGKTGYDKTLAIDLDAAVKCVEASEANTVNRFIMVSAMKADDREAWNSSPIKPYMIAKHYADHLLKISSLDFTILRPGRLTDEDGNGAITLDPDSADHRDIAREDVASTIVSCLNDSNSIGKTFEFIRGDLEIGEAVASL